MTLVSGSYPSKAVVCGAYTQLSFLSICFAERYVRPLHNDNAMRASATKELLLCNYFRETRRALCSPLNRSRVGICIPSLSPRIYPSLTAPSRPPLKMRATVTFVRHIRFLIPSVEKGFYCKRCLCCSGIQPKLKPFCHVRLNAKSNTKARMSSLLNWGTQTDTHTYTIWKSKWWCLLTRKRRGHNPSS